MLAQLDARTASEEGYAAYAISLRGHGGSGGSLRSARLKDYVEDVLRAVEAVDADELVLVGHSLVDCWNEGIPDAPEKSEFSSPVLIIRGEADGFATAELVSSAVAPRFQHVKEEVLSGAGHWPHVQQPQNVAGLIGRFLNELSEASTAPGGAGAQGWINAFASKSPDDFAEAFHRDVVLEASVMRSPITGRENVKTVMSAASSIYESLEFTQQTTNGPRTYLEWQATAFGGLKLYGITILTKDENGQVVSAAIHHRPLDAALSFSAELGKRIGKAVGESRFYSTD